MACEGKCGCLEKLQENEDHNSCPSCGAAEEYLTDTWDSPAIEGFIAIIRTTCDICNCDWKDYYRFVGKREIITHGDYSVLRDQK